MTVPDVMDLSPLFVDSEDATTSSQIQVSYRETAETLTHRLEHDGFVYAGGVPSLSPTYMRTVYEFARRAHALPREIKAKAAEAGVYTGPDVGVVEPSYDGASVSTARAWEYSKHKFTLATKNLEYPEALDYAAFMEDLYARQDALGEAVAVAVADALGLERRALADLARDDYGTIRCMHYPGTGFERSDSSSWTAANSSSGDHVWTYSDEDEGEDEDDAVGIAPHTDFELCTLMHQDAPGLQLLRLGNDNDDAQWVDAPVADDAFIIIVGDTLERLTNGKLKATPHRVVLADRARNSIIRFYALKPDALIEPLPPFVTDDTPPLYTPVTMRKHMATTMANAKNGTPSWDARTQTSLSARYVYDTPDL